MLNRYDVLYFLPEENAILKTIFRFWFKKLLRIDCIVSNLISFQQNVEISNRKRTNLDWRRNFFLDQTKSSEEGVCLSVSVSVCLYFRRREKSDAKKPEVTDCNCLNKTASNFLPSLFVFLKNTRPGTIYFIILCTLTNKQMSRLFKKIIPVHFATGRIEQLLSLMNFNFLSSNQYFL